MRISSTVRLLFSALVVTGAVAFGASHANAQQSAAEAAQALANSLDGAIGGISGADMISTLESAAAAGEPLALWRLGLMYENGEGVAQDRVKAFGFFSRIADDNADTPPRSIEADIVAQSFVKVGEYYQQGLPGAGIQANSDIAHGFLLHAASYFGDADAQYRVGMLYLDENELGRNPLQSARWLSLAARKGHVVAQAALGDLLFNGDGIEAQPVEGLMWLAVAQSHSYGTPYEASIDQMTDRAMSLASPEQRLEAVELAETLASQFGGY
jgi:hypothetical protein